MMKFMRKSKKGVTLVESVFAVVILGILSIGIISLLTAGGQKIFQISHESSNYTEAVQKLDLVISAISNGSDNYITSDPVSLDVGSLQTALGLTGATITATPATYDGTTDYSNSNFRGWYLELTYNGATVKGFASNSEGDFD